MEKLKLPVVDTYPEYTKYKFGYIPTAAGPRANKIHLGTDLFAEVGTDVIATLPGTVIRSEDIMGFGRLNPDGPGGCIIIRSEFEGKVVHLLYGHLVIDKSAGKGMRVEAGQVIGKVIPFYNGKTYCPHIHFGVWLYHNPIVGYLGYDNSIRHWVDPLDFCANPKKYWDILDGNGK